MTSALPALRTQVDRCPGLLRPHRAVDGAMVRLRLPGGRIHADALGAVSRAAVEFGDGQVQLTSRGNLQLRGVPTQDDGESPAGLVDAITRTGLLPSAGHEMVRNITCSPLTGRSGGLADLRGLVAQLDDMICSSAPLARLPGRFLFGLDDGRGDIAGLAHDLGIRAVGPEHAALTIGGHLGPVVVMADAASALRTLALGFLRARGSGATAAWHVSELPDAGAGLLRELSPDLTVGPLGPVDHGGAAPVDVGVLRQRDGRDLLTVGVPLGLLTLDQTRAVTGAAVAHGSGELIITPWRTLLIPDLRSAADPAALADALAQVGLVTDRDSGWRGLSACTGAPGCASAAGRTRPVAALLADSAGGRDDRPVHVVACERRCGSPAVDHVEVLVLGGSRSSVTRRRTGAVASASETACDPTDPTTIPALINAVALARNAPMTQHHPTTVSAPLAEPPVPLMVPPPRRYDYVTDGGEIYLRSFATIRRETDLSGIPATAEKLAVRMVHATGQIDLVADLRVHADLVPAARAALEAGAPIFTDANMVATGVTRARLPAANEVICMLRDPRVPELAKQWNTTRSAAAVSLWGERLAGAVVAIGNAPTALFHLLEMISAGGPRPAVIIGIPVGFIGAIESKEALLQHEAGIPYVVVRGRRGGSALAVAAVNALAQERES